jgi:hypothetical protein
MLLHINYWAQYFGITLTRWSMAAAAPLLCYWNLSIIHECKKGYYQSYRAVQLSGSCVYLERFFKLVV